MRVLDAGELASIGTTRQRALAAHLTHLEMMEALVEAGYRPVTYRRCKGPYTGTELANYFPPGDPKVARRWELDSAGRWVRGSCRGACARRMVAAQVAAAVQCMYLPEAQAALSSPRDPAESMRVAG